MNRLTLILGGLAGLEAPKTPPAPWVRHRCEVCGVRLEANVRTCPEHTASRREAFRLEALERVRAQLPHTPRGEPYTGHTWAAASRFVRGQVLVKRGDRIEALDRPPVPHVRELAGQGGSLLLQGNSGMGKSVLAACIVNELLEQATPGADDDTLRRVARATWTTASRLVRDHREQLRGTEGGGALFRAAYGASLLVLDDLGQEPDPGLHETRVVMELLLDRADDGLPTVVTSGLPSQTLLARYGGGAVRRLVEGGRGVHLGFPPSR